jgi:hypothetical protein
MTKKDYILIANVLHTSLTAATLGFGKTQSLEDIIVDIADYMAEELYEDNPRFDRDKFLDAVGVPEAVRRVV